MILQSSSHSNLVTGYFLEVELYRNLSSVFPQLMQKGIILIGIKCVDWLETSLQIIGKTKSSLLEYH